MHSKIWEKRPHKVYLAVFCGFSTKAIHIDIVFDLTTDAFIGVIPVRAPHFVVLWVAAVESAKHYLIRSVSTSSMKYEELETVAKFRLQGIHHIQGGNKYLTKGKCLETMALRVST